MSLDEAIARLRAGQPRAALPLLESQLASHPDDAQLWYLTGACRFELRDLQGALAAFDRALALSPDNATILHGSALALEDLGKLEQALERYAQAIAASPQHADAHHNRGLLLAKLGRLEDARQSHETYVASCPDAARAHADLADVLLAQERYPEALDAARRATELGPKEMRAAFTAGLACAMQDKFSEATSWLALAESMDPTAFRRFVAERSVQGNLDRDLDPRTIRLVRGFDRLQACDWRGYDEYVALFDRLIEEGVRKKAPLASPPLIFRSLALPMPPGRRRQLADAVSRRLAAGTQRWSPPRTTGDRIRIGYVSPDFGTHPTGILSAPLFGLHARDTFEVHAFSLSPDDGSDTRRRIRADADRFHELDGLGFAQALQRVRDARMDILVDLAGATTGALPELFAQRAAPVQVSYLGFPGTSGAEFVDYLVCDPVCVPPEDGSAYGEALVRLPDTFWICDPGDLPRQPSRSAANLPEDAVVLYAHHPGQKITPEIFGTWMEVLKAVQFAVLWLLEDRPGMAANLRREAKDRGVRPQRLVFAARVPYAEYRSRIALADLALDTPVYNGGATTLDALACGLPVLTCQGHGFAGRMAASALQAAGLGDLVAADLRGYAETAVRLARQREALDALRQRVLRARTGSRLFDVAGRTRQLEAAYQRMHDRATSGQAPAPFDL